tara:strand:- start:1693 stop:3168 length:1476 start_codon:yes stop_codon:yes gene_type:complete
MNTQYISHTASPKTLQVLSERLNYDDSKEIAKENLPPLTYIQRLWRTTNTAMPVRYFYKYEAHKNYSVRRSLEEDEKRTKGKEPQHTTSVFQSVPTLLSSYFNSSDDPYSTWHIGSQLTQYTPYPSISDREDIWCAITSFSLMHTRRNQNTFLVNVKNKLYAIDDTEHAIIQAASEGVISNYRDAKKTDVVPFDNLKDGFQRKIRQNTNFKTMEPSRKDLLTSIDPICHTTVICGNGSDNRYDPSWRMIHARAWHVSIAKGLYYKKTRTMEGISSTDSIYLSARKRLKNTYNRVINTFSTTFRWYPALFKNPSLYNIAPDLRQRFYDLASPACTMYQRFWYTQIGDSIFPCAKQIHNQAMQRSLAVSIFSIALLAYTSFVSIYIYPILSAYTQIMLAAGSMSISGIAVIRNYFTCKSLYLCIPNLGCQHREYIKSTNLAGTASAINIQAKKQDTPTEPAILKMVDEAIEENRRRTPGIRSWIASSWTWRRG